MVTQMIHSRWNCVINHTMVIEKLLVVVLKIIKDFFKKKIPELIPSALDYG